jgi:polynucleotide 5'-kinase involved in rRNA processing
MNRVVNLNQEEYDVFIGRGSKWGNPFTHIKDKATLAEVIVDTREEAIERYRVYLSENQDLMNSLDELEGKILGCYCKPKSCHGDILLEFLSKRKLTKFLKKDEN